MSIEINTPWGAVVQGALSIIDKVIPDPAAKAAAQLQVLQLNQTGQLADLKSSTDLALAQIGVDNTEAASTSLYKSGWRPTVGWVCCIGLAYQFLALPLLAWLGANIWKWAPPPSLDMGTLMTLLGGLLGLGAMRTVEKLQDKA